MLEAKGINAFYGRKQVLFDTSISVKEGEKVILIGPNGAGKSTLLKAIVGLLTPTKGQIAFSGEDISSWPPQRRINSGIGYLLQNENIVPGLTVEENLLLGAYPIKGDPLKKGLEEVFEVFGFMKGRLKDRAGFLSGGERQALAVSMVLMKHPRLLLLDEPTAGLAPKAAQNILEHVKKAQDVIGVKAVCLVEHNLKLALEWASKVIVLVQGRVVFTSDTPELFINNPEELEKYFFE